MSQRAIQLSDTSGRQYRLFPCKLSFSRRIVKLIRASIIVARTVYGEPFENFCTRTGLHDPDLTSKSADGYTRDRRNLSDEIDNTGGAAKLRTRINRRNQSRILTGLGNHR